MITVVNCSVCYVRCCKTGFQLGDAEVLGGLRNFMITDRPGHHSIDHPEGKSKDRKWPVLHPQKLGTNVFM